MFGIVVEIRSPDREALRTQHTTYSELVRRFPGIHHKHVLQSDEDPTRFIDVMLWETQAQSEAFGIDPEYQRLRPAAPRGAPMLSERGWMTPGYYDLVIDERRPSEAERRASTRFYETTPGRERDLEAAAQQLAARAAGVEGVMVYRNRGQPNRYVLVVLGADDGLDPGLLSALEACCPAPPATDHGELVVRYDFV
jgi:heme-degrading monooxygenase HmoA